MIIPKIQYQDKYIITILAEEKDRQETIDVFAQGYSTTNPFFVALEISQEEIKSFIQCNISQNLKCQEYLKNPVLIVKDQSKNNKIIAVIVGTDYYKGTNYPEKLSKGLLFKQYMDYQVMATYKPQGKKLNTFCTGFSSVLPEYQGQKLYPLLCFLGFYQVYKAGYTTNIDILYNKISQKVIKNMFPTMKIIRSLDMSNEYYNGRQIFKDNNQVSGVSYILDLKELFDSNNKLVPQEYLPYINQLDQILEQNKQTIQPKL